jgi:hypothetical protein
LKSIKSTLSEEELDQQIRALESSNQDVQSQIALSNVEMVADTTEMEKIQEDFVYFRNEWKRRKQWFTNVWNAITDNYPGNIQELRVHQIYGRKRSELKQTRMQKFP